MNSYYALAHNLHFGFDEAMLVRPYSKHNG